jgi:hypothetical protein
MIRAKEKAAYADSHFSLLVKLLLLNRPSTRDQLHEKYDNCDHEQNVNEISNRCTGKTESQCP